MDPQEERARRISDAVAGLYPIALVEVAALSEDQRAELAAELASVIGSRADVLVASDGRVRALGKTVALAAVAKGIAVLAAAPGGVEFGALHYCRAPHEGCPGGMNGVRRS